MTPDNENSVDPTVKTLVEMFPEDFLRNTARETGVVERERKIDIVILFWVTTLGFGIRFLSTIRGLKQKYEEKARTTLSISSFYDRFTPEMVDFLRKCVLHAIEFQAQQIGRVLDDKLKRFKDLVIQDSTIIRLHESLAKIWPAARTKKVAAGIKVSCVVSAVADSPKSVRIYPERTSEAKILRLGPWLRDRILLIDLGYFKFKELKSYYRMDKIPSENPNIVKCLIWIAILTLMCSRRILRLIRNANPENAYRYTHLRWAKVFTGQADRLLTEVVECMGLKLDMLTIYDIYLGQGCDPNVKRERLMERWVT